MTRGGRLTFGGFGASVEPKTKCPRGHDLVRYNARPPRNRGKTPTCRACHTAFQWAKSHDLFNDDPRTIAHANELFAQYQEN